MKIYKITEASEYLGVSINTLKTLANNGKIKSFKTTGEHRRFRQDDLDAYMGVEKEKQEKLTVIYARCSTAKQKENLERQKDRLRKHAEAKSYKYMMIDEIASGINEKRNGIHKLIKMCFEGKVERVLIEYKDRLARFGYEYLDAIFNNLEITVEVVETKKKKYEEELEVVKQFLITGDDAAGAAARAAARCAARAAALGDEWAAQNHKLHTLLLQLGR
jgi:excisionase family DNA binding protein